MKTEKVLNYHVFTDDLNKISLNQKSVINTINQYSYCIARKDSEFSSALVKSDILLPDGIGITMASRLFKGKKIKKIAGADIHKHLLEKLNETGGTCFYLGSSPNTLNKIKDKLSKEYPNVKVHTFSPPFKPILSEEDSLEMIAAVNKIKPQVLFIGMTAPKQEKWATNYKDKLQANVICSIGAVFDFYAGTVPRPSKIWINMGMEWFIRLVKEPKRMWKRYLYYGPAFVWFAINDNFSKN